MLSFTYSNLITSGLPQANNLLGSRASYRTRPSVSSACDASLMETIRRIECLSQEEIKVLTQKTAAELNTVLKSRNLTKIPSLEENIGVAYSILQKTQNKTLLGNTPFHGIVPSGSNSSPFLTTARGFKTKRSESTTDKPFTTLKTSSGSKLQTEALNDILKHIDLPTKEKEKVNIALLSYAAGFSSGKDRLDGEGERGTGKGEKKKWFEWNRIHNLASLLVIVALVISLSKVFNVSMNITKGGNEISPEEIEVTFEDVKGCDEAKRELQEVVEFLVNPDKFSILGGKLPKGCLLVGPPGTGKTLLARAVAGQAGVPFFHATGSEFDEVLVGQGARRVRDLFKAAKARAPCVIFIDEIDSVGSKRTSSALHPYANQTINQLLSEMDGFMSNEGVIVLGATNRAEDLDKALLRPGRFDTQVMVTNPDIKGRREILILYLAKIKHDDSVNLEKLAKMTVGFSGADLQNMVNTAAIRAAVDGKEWVSMAEFEYSHDKHVLGTDWKSRVREKSDLEITAYHEAGHTLVAYFTEDAQPIHKVTIVAKGQSGGHTAFLPEDDSWHVTKSQLLARMDVGMGGRAAEELIFGKEKITGGASSDLQSATNIAENMVKSLGMSEKIGLRVVQKDELAPGSTELMDLEITKMMNESYKRATQILKTHRKELDMLAEALIHYETLDSDDVKTILENKRPPPARPSASTVLGYNTPRLPFSDTPRTGALPPVSPPGPLKPEGADII
ncbi:ATP-dependent zinc metalloprotease YME1 homolog [Eurytemora carolleeae]|uniref:ATP-dependent zinc metalloprotease YME1 homolog n=1 Tax=Eurytemora carolleeae TaxID=1294199 RepID=UPI000C77BD38|nr:ATP-dependent zinc metalloprotease YME1 homolog [Eurytemora carolleeae]|eukprot:XP_023340672.1 ATP-dependent zinc metalloprotease YME1 homolog [Eurytemora affinis]